eukprot:gnl/TRDRNA2_/TRDRNA2_154642_c0_seq2.p1 gnl/TRDRNA2_/TRDRNA2_154642_c0~~gnl/TRDRNA2_/TRDRNA2_154642_c0_seq2.p1  ORF type:complete len:485 (-),score=47.37 gnl/TRDRNA2_/TRDRNA2_154642_c0_seq2:168-1622(-)
MRLGCTLIICACLISFFQDGHPLVEKDEEISLLRLDVDSSSKSRDEVSNLLPNPVLTVVPNLANKIVSHPFVRKVKREIDKATATPEEKDEILAIECLEKFIQPPNEVILPAVIGSDAKRFYQHTRVHSTWMDTQEPIAIVVPAKYNQGVAGIEAAVSCGKQNNIKVTALSGGHTNQPATLGGIAIHLSNLDDVVCLGGECKEVAIGAGASMGVIIHSLWTQTCESWDIDQTDAKGCRIVPVGRRTNTGFGLVASGGIGLDVRHLGLSCDSLVEVCMVTANGERGCYRQGSELFWATCGGGGGTVGIVYAYTLKTWDAKGPLTKYEYQYAKDPDKPKWEQDEALVAFINEFEQWAMKMDARTTPSFEVREYVGAAINRFEQSPRIVGWFWGSQDEFHKALLAAGLEDQKSLIKPSQFQHVSTNFAKAFLDLSGFVPGSTDMDGSGVSGIQILLGKYYESNNYAAAVSVFLYKPLAAITIKKLVD